MVYSDRTARGVRLSVWLVLAASVAIAQVYPGGYPPGGGYPGGGYPGGGYPYPGGGYPGGGGTGIPIPGRRSGGQPKADPNQPLPNFRGKLKHMDEKTITLALGDERTMDFRRTSKTKFFKNGDEIKSPQFAVGDQISVEGPEQADGSMTAVNVYWEKAGATPTTTAGTTGSEHSPDKDKAEGVPDTWAKDAPSGAPAQPQASANADPDRPVLRRAPSAESAPPNAPAPPAPPAPAAAPAAPAAPQPQASASVDTPPPPDPDRPVLRRGKPADSAREQSDPVPYQANPPATSPAAAPQQPVTTASAAPGNPPVLRRADDDDAPIVNRPIDQTDQLIRRATDAALDFTESLPAYVCQEMMSRYQSETRPARFNALDVLTMNLVYENGKEDYRDLAINGRHTDKTLQESGGAWSTGEFGTVLIDLFAPATGANFQYERDSRAAGIPAKLYNFEVKKENSHWDVHAMSQSYSPAYKGAVWIDPQTARVLRIEMEAVNIPAGFPLDTVESATDYQYVRLGDAQQYLLPVHAENLSCQRGTPYCSKIAIDFRNYHKYTGESTITFGQPQK